MTLRGIVAPALTPFDARLEIDVPRFVAHCRWLLDQGCAALAPFGTTSEANSLSIDEREAMLDALLDAGIAPSKLIPGVGCCALPDTLRLAKRAASCAGVLALPPFYYKNVSEEGLYRNYAQLIERARAKVFLYHIPQMTSVPLPLTLVQRLHRDYPGHIVGMKDSGSDFEYTRKLIEALPDLIAFSGSEKFLSANLAAGGAGCITATANVNAAALSRVARDPTPAGQAELDATRTRFESLPMIPALKETLATRDPAWRTVRPPLVELNEAQRGTLRSGALPPV
jgi:4-hydroxy-tetrahydrodipicolinate synthase